MTNNKILFSCNFISTGLRIFVGFRGRSLRQSDGCHFWYRTWYTICGRFRILLLVFVRWWLVQLLLLVLVLAWRCLIAVLVGVVVGCFQCIGLRFHLSLFLEFWPQRYFGIFPCWLLGCRIRNLILWFATMLHHVWVLVDLLLARFLCLLGFDRFVWNGFVICG